MKQPMISTLFLTHLDEMILERGASPADLVKESGLPATVLNHTETLIPFALHSGLLEKVSDRLRWPTMTLELGSRQSIGYLGPMYPLLCKAQSVREALKIFNKHLTMQANAVHSWVDESEFIAEFHLSIQLPIIAQSPRFQDHALSLARNLIQWMCGPSWQPRAVFFPRQAPENVAAYTGFFGTPVAFDSDKLSITFSREFLDKPFKSDLKNIPDQFRRGLENREIFDASSQVSYTVQSIQST